MSAIGADRGRIRLKLRGCVSEHTLLVCYADASRVQQRLIGRPALFADVALVATPTVRRDTVRRLDDATVDNVARVPTVAVGTGLWGAEACHGEPG